MIRVGGQRLRRSVAALAALLFLGTFAPPGLFSEARPVRAAVITYEAVPLDSDAPERSRLGRLTFLSGWRLSSDNPRFGGISAMHVDGRAVLALTDAGTLIRFPLPRSSNGRLQGAIDSLRDGPGSPVVKRDRDTESLIVGDNHAWIGFERRNAVWRYRLNDWRSDAQAAPAAMRDWPNNTGPEAMVRLPNGHFLVFSEAAPNEDGTTQVVYFVGDPAEPGTTSIRLSYRAPAGYRVTDAALLPDGRLLLLNRRFALLEGLSAKLLVAPNPKPEAGTIIQGQEIADFRSPVTVDNMEALSITREGKQTIVWLASDDNFNPIQRSLLLKFALVR